MISILLFESLIYRNKNISVPIIYTVETGYIYTSDRKL